MCNDPLASPRTTGGAACTPSSSLPTSSGALVLAVLAELGHFHTASNRTSSTKNHGYYRAHAHDKDAYGKRMSRFSRTCLLPGKLDTNARRPSSSKHVAPSSHPIYRIRPPGHNGFEALLIINLAAFAPASSSLLAQHHLTHHAEGETPMPRLTELEARDDPEFRNFTTSSCGLLA